MSTEEKLELLLSAVALMAVGTDDEHTRTYCAKILEELGEFERIEKFISYKEKHN